MNFYNMWFLILLLLGTLFYVLGLYFIPLDYVILIDWDILTLNSCSVVMTLFFDWMSLLFAGSVMFISSMVVFYSGVYMISDENSVRFLFLVVMFVASMCLMILSPNLISILLGWDGLGLVSYCLVIYFHNFKSYNAGMLTVLTNRVGDVAILLGIGVLFNSGSWYFMIYSFYFYNWTLILCLLVILASFTKSAQIPFSSWLPAAMAAPTPVSALVHSSTLVTAGVYLLIRFENLLFFFNLDFILLLSVLTMFMAGLGANYEYDMKKIIALSTLSQLGLMMSILFMGYPVVAFFHLLTHAFFKALLFLCAGLIIHCMNDTQDIRFMGGLVNMLPCTSAFFGIANLSLCGLPFLSGFYSKDLIVELLTVSYFNFFIYLLFYISVGLTAFYSMRLIYYSMINYIGLFSLISFFEDSVMVFSMILLVLMGIIKGSILSWLLFPFPFLLTLPLDCKLLALFFVALGSFLGYELSLMNFNSHVSLSFICMFLGNMWFMPFFSTYMINCVGLSLSSKYISFLEYSWGEYLISGLLYNWFVYLSKLNFYLQKNSISVYLLVFFLFSFLLVL
uniref:NADH-ubiquinone oxidoreductase chain 5 n=1 Tax=Cryptorhamphus sp. TaxID=2931285 RepID=A0A8T9ZXD3_9HEMI|nr:NADH dehydrogenase subunit 5 [Cryptorhamphus sp.]